MPVFPSAQWIDEFCTQLAAHPQAVHLADSLAGTYRFVIDPGGPLTHAHVYSLEIRPSQNGAPPHISAREDVGRTGEKPELTLTASYPYWRKLIAGTLDVGMALILRRIKVGGNLQRLTSRLSSAQPLLDTLHAVHTVWLEDALDHGEETA